MVSTVQDLDVPVLASERDVLRIKSSCEGYRADLALLTYWVDKTL
jgi:hypothetical protein